MKTILIPVAFTALSALLAHVLSERDGADYSESTQYIVRAAYYLNAAIVSVVAWVAWWII
ncbi:hypothetical protein [Pusillimonas sp. ANT_WB101]|uniref:hypothetical protein n=1 Tax=Pusillimonas sp. ANT_WB101 TaxID=2597356 RepID=UPI0011F021DB|nr:hypothetical protein [Pusillimonas sp. ANT_WB101]KAA0910632.1 hypothetical protein FQ179_01785 [Pusillimonas sp. ANT_WB101]